jgi:hypothetical protein
VKTIALINMFCLMVIAGILIFNQGKESPRPQAINVTVEKDYPLPSNQYQAYACGGLMEKKVVAVSGAWVQMRKGRASVMLEIDGKWREVIPEISLHEHKSIEVTAEQIEQSQPLGWLYKEGG